KVLRARIALTWRLEKKKIPPSPPPLLSAGKTLTFRMSFALTLLVPQTEQTIAPPAACATRLKAWLLSAAKSALLLMAAIVPLQASNESIAQNRMLVPASAPS